MSQSLQPSGFLMRRPCLREYSFGLSCFDPLQHEEGIRLFEKYAYVRSLTYHRCSWLDHTTHWDGSSSVFSYGSWPDRAPSLSLLVLDAQSSATTHGGPERHPPKIAPAQADGRAWVTVWLMDCRYRRCWRLVYRHRRES